MNLVLAIEPDASQADRLTTLVRTLGANLQLVASSNSAIVAMNQRVPDVVLLGRTLSAEHRTAAVTQLRSLITDSAKIRILDTPDLKEPLVAEAFGRKIGVSLAAVDYVQQQSAASTVDQEWNSVAIDAPAQIEELHAADEDLIEAEVEVRLKGELARLQAEAAQQQARELARVEAEAADRHAREIARVEAEAVRQRTLELAKLEQDNAMKRDSAVADAEARAAAEGAARAALAAELERVRRESEAQLAAEVQRIRNEGEQALATQRDLAQAQAERDREERIARARAETDAAKAAAEASKAAAIEEARRVVEEAAARAQMAEDEVERVRAEANAQLKAAVAKAREESEARLQEEVTRAQRETEARLEAQLASVIGEAEQFRHAHREISEDAAKIREDAARAARVAAETRLAAETARIRAEANERLKAEIARLRAEAARAQNVKVDDIPMFASSRDSGSSALVAAARQALTGIRWDYVATAALIIFVVVAGALYLPRAVRTAAHTSSTLVGTAGQAAKAAAKEAAAVAPVVTRRALNAAERAIPRSAAGKADADQPPPEQNDTAADVSDSGRGFMTVYSRIPMQVYVDGKRVGASDDGQLMLSNGTHRVELVNDHFHYRSSTSITITPGRVQPYNVTLPTAQVQVTTTPGAEVFVEGERVGVAPLDAIAVPIGTREIAARDANGEKRQVVEVKYGDTLELSLIPQADGDQNAPAVPRLAPLSRSR
ncbi:MAG TPA: hypothetical protein VL693_11570 [Vicinamibacterales bacterium]|jgi:hypothetical protein|nr:hypothetical protein [Vicinamibacterales bacterium]